MATGILTVALVFFSSRVQSEAQSINKRPRVGLALSGGGSLGMAHVGVLKVMEEAGLRPDVISGVSMGSIIGGMYSIGYSPDSLHKILRTTDWDFILSNKIPENKVIFTEKYNFNNSAMSLPVTTKKLKLPSGLINGQQIESMLSFYAWPAAQVNDFSKLPVPFTCVATDIKTIRIVEFTKGYLPDAMRASMAVPSIFTPVRIDTAILIDGGLLRNIAIGELKDMGADIVIGSYTGFHLYDVDELESMAGIMKQIGFLNSVTDYAVQKKMADVIIEPYLKDFSSTVFNNADSIIQRGYNAALPFRDLFRRLADSLDNIGPQPVPEYILDREFYRIDSIEIHGNDIISDEQITGVLDIHSGSLINKHLLKDKIELLYGKSWFEKVSYKLIPANESLILRIECIEKPNAIIYGSVHYDNGLGPGIILNLSVRNLLHTKNFFDFNSYISTYYRYRLKNTLFLDRNQKLGLTTLLYMDNTSVPVVAIRGEMGRIYRRHYKAEMSFDKSIGLNNMMNLSVSIESLDHIPKYISLLGLKRISYNYWSGEFHYYINSLDNKHFPRKGNISQFSLGTSKLYSGDVKTSRYENTFREDYPDDFLFKRAYRVNGNFRHYFPGGSGTTFSVNGAALFSFSNDSISSPNNYFFLGGTTAVTDRSVEMTGFHQNEIIIDKLAGIGFDAEIEIAGNFYLNLMTDIAVAHESGKDKSPTYLAGYGIGASYMTVIGPVRAGIMHGISSARRYFSGIKGYITIGYNF